MMNKKQKYEKILPIIKSVISDKSHMISNLANFSSIIQNEFQYHWVGFYLADDLNQQLFLGPFQGPLACTEIPYGKGVCGSSWKEQKTLIVPNVHEFSGHIACSTLTNSEIVLPFTSAKTSKGVLDIDSTELDSFDQIDADFLKIALSFLP